MKYIEKVYSNINCYKRYDLIAIIGNAKGIRYLYNTLKLLSKISRLSILLIIVDVYTSKDDIEIKIINNLLNKYNVDYIYVLFKYDFGAENLRNIAIGISMKYDYDYILILDNDTLVTQLILERIIKLMRNYNIKVATSVLYNLDGTIQFCGGYYSHGIYREYRNKCFIKNNIAITYLLHGAFFVLSKDTIKKIYSTLGSMYPLVFNIGMADYYLSNIIRKMNIDMYIFHFPKIIHIGGATQSRLTSYRIYEGAKNLFLSTYFVEKSYLKAFLSFIEYTFYVLVYRNNLKPSAIKSLIKGMVSALKYLLHDKRLKRYFI